MGEQALRAVDPQTAKEEQGEGTGTVVHEDPSPATRFSVKLIPAAQKAMAKLMARTGLSKTDVTNRAVQVYGYLEDRKGEGYEILLRDPNGAVERLQIM
ncbi:hypothetical protein [Streptodolium elevatio]|uniref:Uncharacterized protein n=1 Tax=Streptodolium elevatio TaxID=3157996 RepID=A0ABV3DS93_9ACTN